MLAHLRHPERVGRLGPHAAAGEAGSRACGDLVRIEIDVDGGRVQAARFQAYGCPATIAGGAEVARRVEGLSILEAARISSHEIATSLDLPLRKRGCSNLAADALHGALEDVERRGMPLMPAPRRADRDGVLVAMSGGVDSAVAALLLKRRGVALVGVTFRLWSDPVCGRANTCCSPATIRRARATAHRLGIPHLTVDLGAPFYEVVVEPFVAEYTAGRTPNPCVRCNACLRFDRLVNLAERLGLGRVATGHYARLVREPARLARARDRSKDQSYVLAQVDPRLLARVEFPLGSLTKQETRAIAREAGLEPRGYRESQEICFIPDNDRVRFLQQRLGRLSGDIVDTEGRVRGRHDGVYRYTVGQRRGLGVAATEPLYVVALHPEQNLVVVGGADRLAVSRVWVDELVRHTDALPVSADVQLRSSGAPAEVVVNDRGEGLLLESSSPLRGVAPGQTAVLYEGDLVVAAGIIRSAGEPEGAMV